MEKEKKEKGVEEKKRDTFFGFVLFMMFFVMLMSIALSMRQPSLEEQYAIQVEYVCVSIGYPDSKVVFGSGFCISNDDAVAAPFPSLNEWEKAQ